MPDLPKRELGRTRLQVTMLGYGAMEPRGAPRGRDVTEGKAETILHDVLDSGINYIDTSIDYELGEERIGRYIASHPDMVTNIVGTINPAHLQDNIAALRKGPLPPALYADAKRRLATSGSTP